MTGLSTTQPTPRTAWQQCYGKHSRAYKFMELVEQQIQNELQQASFGVPELAQKTYLSVSQLNRSLNKYLGVSAGQLIRIRRLEQAAAYLMKGEASVSEIAWRVGYANPSNFTRSFKNHFGMPPSALLPS